MKNIKSTYIILIVVLVMQSCNQDVLKTEAPPVTVDTSCETATAGTANFTKFVAIGNSYVAGFQAGALFNEGQANSLPAILNKQFKCVGGDTTFNQPDINSVNGYNIQSSITNVITLGRLILFDPDGPTGPRTAGPYPSQFPGSSVTCPSEVVTPALPSPYNTADIPTAYTGVKANLNNFGVPLIFLGQALIPDTGNPASPYFNPLWARFASQPGVKSIVQDALTAGGSFYLIWLGFDDVLLYAATGADGVYPMTSLGAFSAQYSSAITTMLGANPSFKGVVGNIPNFTSIPYFYTVKWNQIILDEAKATTLTSSLGANYNAFLDAMVTNGVITTTERDKRKLTYAAGNNPILMTDESLVDLTPYMDASNATKPLKPYAQARQTTSTDLVPLAAGSILGTCYSGQATAVYGVSYPVSDRYILTPTETEEILTRTAALNAAIGSAVSSSNDRLALADVNKAYGDFVTAKAIVENGVTLKPSFAPPTGAFSEDGLHPNSRGYAFTANIFIDAINAKFNSTIPHTDLSKYKGTTLPINP